MLDEQGAAGTGGEKTIEAKILPYRMIGGQGRKRSKAYVGSHGQANRAWVVPFITTAEDELDAGGEIRREGAQVRMVAIPFPPTWEGGMFCSVTDETERSRLAQLVETTIAANYGMAMPRFLKKLVKNRTALETEIVDMREVFVKKVGAASNSWEKRYAEKFAIVLAAARLLVRYDIAPWTEERAVEAVTRMYKSSRASTVSVPEATDAALRKLRVLVETGKRFPKLPKGKSLKSEHRKKA